jgi:hypothetical protein
VNRAILSAAALAALPIAAAAQSHPLVGAWKVDYAGGMQLENGVATPIRRTGTMTIEAKGDSLIATLVADASDGAPPRPAARLAGKSASGAVTFVSRSQATLNINGAEQQATSVATWTLEAHGDELEGTVARKLEGVDTPSGGPQPVTGTRLKT